MLPVCMHACGITYCNLSCLNFLLVTKIITVTTISPTAKTAITTINTIIVVMLSSSSWVTWELVDGMALALLVGNGTWGDDEVDDVASGQMQTATKAFVQCTCVYEKITTVIL